MIAKSFKEAIVEMMGEIAKQIPDSHKQTPVKAYLTGGGAVHYYCNKRVSDDVDLIMQYTVNVPSIQNIIKTGKVDKDELFELATDAINVGVGFQKRAIETNLGLVMEMFE